MKKRYLSALLVLPLLLFACGDETPTSTSRAGEDAGTEVDTVAGVVGDGATASVGDSPSTVDEAVQSDPADDSTIGTPNAGTDVGGNLTTDAPASDTNDALDNAATETPPLEPRPPLLPTPTGNGSFFDTYLDLESFPYDAIVSGGPGKDGIPALTNPQFVSRTFVRYLDDDDMVLGVVIDGQAKAYPHNIGWWHEIVNDRIGNRAISVTFCPLTGTGLVFNATDTDGSQFELGVSGLLFNSNLIMYDRRDGATLYTQLAFKGVSGPRRGDELELLPVVETTWATWKELYPRTLVVSEGTYSIDRYLSYPYGDYRTNNNYFLFALDLPLSRNNNPYVDEFSAKDRVLGVRLDGQAKAYAFATMGEQAVINDQVGGVDIAVVWDREHHLAIPYARQVGDRVLSFERIEREEFPFFGLVDRETGTIWTALGEAVEGELVGEHLLQVPAHTSMWFAWVTFWRDTDVWR